MGVHVLAEITGETDEIYFVEKPKLSVASFLSGLHIVLEFRSLMWETIK